MVDNEFYELHEGPLNDADLREAKTNNTPEVTGLKPKEGAVYMARRVLIADYTTPAVLRLPKLPWDKIGVFK